jgi:hypothetical protein
MKDAIKRNLRLAKIVEQYNNGGHTLQEIGSKIGVSRQRVHQILKQSGVATRPTKPRRRTLDRDLLERLYIDERKNLGEVVKAVRASHPIVKRELERHGIDLRPSSFSRIKPSELDGLEVGKAITIECKFKKKYYSTIYSKAAVRGMRISISRIDSDRVNITRIQ